MDLGSGSVTVGRTAAWSGLPAWISGLAAFAIWLCAAGVAMADSRVALVIGNSAYRHVPALPNPANDAADVAASLQRLGFSVVVAKDAAFDDVRRALIEFGGRAREADMAIVYFAGHGLQIDGENWIVPVDAALNSDSDVETETVGLKSLVSSVSGARTLGLVILDACRNNPFDAQMRRVGRTRAVSRGLAPVEPPDNVLVAYAAKDGTAANDGNGRNSPFTSALLQHVETPGLEIDFLFRNVRDDVLAATDGRQQPFFYGSLSREAVYLSGRPAEDNPADPPKPVATADEVAWPFLAATTDAALVRRFTVAFPASRHRAEADRRLAALEAAPAAPLVLATAQPAAARETAGPTADQTAVGRQFTGSTPAVESAWSFLKTGADPALLRRFTDEFPGRQRSRIVAALNGVEGTAGVLRQLRGDEMHAVLSTYGQFVRHPRYGEVWVPAVTPKGWHPYEPCHWVRTRQFDWYYLDRTPWGAIVHHYGRWTHDDQLGWIWVPGLDFSPGWVVWRAGAEQIGWAPMPAAADLPSLTVDGFDKAAFWTFMDRAAFAGECKAPVASPAASPRVMAPLVREVKLAGGIPVFVLPIMLPNEAPDVEVAFDPWSAALASQTLVDWNILASLETPAVCPVPATPMKVETPLVAPVAAPPTRAAKPAPKTVRKAVVREAPRKPAPVAERRIRRQPPRDEEPAAPAAEPERVYVPEPRPYYVRPMARPLYPLGGFGGLGGFGITGGFGGSRGSYQNRDRY